MTPNKIQGCKKPKKVVDRASGSKYVQPFEVQYIFTPDHPATGENTASDPAFLGGGLFQRLTNLVYSNGGLKMRNGIKKLTSSVPVAGASFRGAFSGYLDGQTRLYAAYRVSGATRVYEVTNLTGSPWGFTEITAGSGIAANDETAAEAGTNNGTRFTADGWISFAIVTDGLGPTPTDMLIFGNGINAPRVHSQYRKLFAGVQTVATTHGTVPAPDISLCTSWPDVTAYLDARTAGAATISNAGSVVLTHPAVAGESYFNFVVSGLGTGTVAMNGGSASWFHNGTTWVNQNALNLSFGGQLWLVVDDASTETVWPYMKVSVYDGTTTQVVYDPTSANYAPPALLPLNDSSTQYIAAFDLNQAQITITQVTSVIFECVAAPTAAKTFQVDGILVGGKVPGDAQYTISYIHSSSRSEGAGVVAKIKNGPPLGGKAGRGCASNRVTGNVEPSSLLQVRQSISYPYLTAGSPVAPRVDYAMLYRQDSGESTYTFVAPMGMPSSSSWGNISIYSDNTQSGTRYINRQAPIGSNISTPYGGVFSGIGGRLFVGKGKEVFISGDRAPFRFSYVTQLTGPTATTGPAYHSFQGENVTAIQKMPGQQYGLSPIAIFTDQTIWRLEGISTTSLSRATAIALIGCPFPKTIATYLTNIFYVGSDRQIRRLGSATYLSAYGPDDPLSLYQVDDRIETIDLSKSSAAASFKGYSLAHISGADTAPKDILQFDSITGKWNSAYVYVPDVSGMLSFQSGTDTKLLGFDDQGDIYHLFKPGQLDDDGTAITFTIKTPEYHNGQWTQMYWQSIGMVADTIAAQPTFNITRFCPRSNQTQNTVLKFASVTGNRLYRTDQIAGDTLQGKAGMIDLSCVITITGQMPAGTHIQSIIMHTRNESSGPDRAAN